MNLSLRRSEDDSPGPTAKMARAPHPASPRDTHAGSSHARPFPPTSPGHAVTVSFSHAGYWCQRKISTRYLMMDKMTPSRLPGRSRQTSVPARTEAVRQGSGTERLTPGVAAPVSRRHCRDTGRLLTISPRPGSWHNHRPQMNLQNWRFYFDFMQLSQVLCLRGTFFMSLYLLLKG